MIAWTRLTWTMGLSESSWMNRRSDSRLRSSCSRPDTDTCNKHSDSTYTRTTTLVREILPDFSGLFSRIFVALKFNCFTVESKKSTLSWMYTFFVQFIIFFSIWLSTYAYRTNYFIAPNMLINTAPTYLNRINSFIVL